MVLQNELLRVTVLAGRGADIVEFLYKPLDVDFMWANPSGPVPTGTEYGPTEKIKVTPVVTNLSAPAPEKPPKLRVFRPESIASVWSGTADLDDVVAVEVKNLPEPGAQRVQTACAFATACAADLRAAIRTRIC